eukprot:2821478-Alexandrium_andersonii.AAC.1
MSVLLQVVLQPVVDGPAPLLPEKAAPPVAEMPNGRGSARHHLTVFAANRPKGQLRSFEPL